MSDGLHPVAEETMEVSIIVVSWNVCELLKACLQAIEQEIGLDPESYEVLVFDNNSSDHSAAMVAELFPKVHLTANTENLGFGRANNRAFAQCRGEFVLLLNPDTEIRPGAVVHMLQLMRENPNAAILGARLVNPDGSFQRSSGGALPTVWNATWHYLFLNELLPKRWAPLPTFLIEDRQGTFDIGWVSGAAMLLRRAAFSDFIFDKQFFMYGEDLELCDRMRTAGWRVLFTSEATVMHRLRQSLAKQSSAEILASAVTGNRAYFLVRHGRFRTWCYDLVLTIGYMFRWIAFVVLSILRSNVGDADKLVTNKRYAFVSLKSLCRGGR